MIRTTIAGTAMIAVCTLPVAAQTSSAPAIKNYQVEGNLSPNEPIDCAPLDQVSAGSNPVDLYRAALECIETDKFDLARELVLLGDIRGRFDTKRVKDRTAHQAVSVAKSSVFASLDDDQTKKQRDSFQVLLNPSQRLEFCERVAAAPAPSYFPRYMVAHGMGAFTGRIGPGSLVENFDAETVYRDVAEDYMNCPEARAELAES